MSNMSYCRYGNTYQDLLDCYYDIREGDPSELSEEESRAKTDLIKLCVKILDETGELEKIREEIEIEMEDY